MKATVSVIVVVEENGRKKEFKLYTMLVDPSYKVESVVNSIDRSIRNDLDRIKKCYEERDDVNW